MIEPIVSSAAPIVLIGGAQVDPRVVSDALKFSRSIVCADGGANTAYDLGLAPLAVIGDMDSIGEAARAAFAPAIHQIPEQDTTDFDKALRHIAAPLVIGVGFLGDRLDHAMAGLHVLLKNRDRPVVLLGDHDVVFMSPAEITLELPVGSRVSLMPVTDVRVRTEGLRWEVDGSQMSMRDFIGSSNQAAAARVTVHATEGLAIMLAPQALAAVVDGLQDAVRAGLYKAPPGS